jgi:hypothetical protein
MSEPSNPVAGAASTDHERRTLVAIPVEECWRLLAVNPVGRIGVLTRHEPEIYPVNHIVDHHTIVFRIGPSDILMGLSTHPRVSFQVDGIDVDTRTGWSVLVKGTARVDHEPDPDRRPTTLPVESWPDGPRTRWVRVTPTEITGRRISRSGAVHRAQVAPAPGAVAAPNPDVDIETVVLPRDADEISTIRAYTAAAWRSLFRRRPGLDRSPRPADHDEPTRRDTTSG